MMKAIAEIDPVENSLREDRVHNDAELFPGLTGGGSTRLGATAAFLG
jgi:hypothetical protein